MPPFMVDMLPLILGSLLGPAQFIFTVLLLRSADRGVLKASSFILGMTVMRLVQGILFGFVMDEALKSVTQKDKPGVVSTTLLLVLGIFLLITAYQQWRHEDDLDKPPTKWFKWMDRITPMQAFGIGFVWVATSFNLWVFTLSAIAVIGESPLNLPDSVLAYLLFILLVESLMLLAILMRVTLPGKAETFLNNMSVWLLKHNPMLIASTSLVFGLFFLVKGISRFLAF
jgi:cytochrome bd-type quinol oxidase subunit 2